MNSLPRLLLPALAAADTVTGSVVKVVDSDTVYILDASASMIAVNLPLPRYPLHGGTQLLGVGQGPQEHSSSQPEQPKTLMD